jgi:hypothetical protein
MAADCGNLTYMLALLLVEQGQAHGAAHWLDEAGRALPNQVLKARAIIFGVNIKLVSLVNSIEVVSL